jgi:hypothetical protein
MANKDDNLALSVRFELLLPLSFENTPFVTSFSTCLLWFLLDRVWARFVHALFLLILSTFVCVCVCLIFSTDLPPHRLTLHCRSETESR